MSLEGGSTDAAGAAGRDIAQPPDAIADPAQEVLQDTDGVLPEPGLYLPRTKRRPRPHIEAVRRDIALIIVSALVLLYGMTIGTALWSNIPNSRLTAVLAGLSGLSSLAAAVVGFYFGQKHKND